MYFILDSLRQFFVQESSFYSSLESTKWLKCVSYCLQRAVEASEYINEGIPVILQGIYEEKFIYYIFLIQYSDNMYNSEIIFN